MSPHTVMVILSKEMRDARRNMWFVIISLLFALLAISLSLLGLAGLGNFGVAGFGRTAASLLNLVLLIVPLMGLLLGAMSIVSEREQGTLLTLLAQPVTMNEIFLGKYIGSACALVATILLGFGSSGLVIAHYAGLEEIGDYLLLVIFTLLLGLAYLSIGFCISICARRNAMAIGLALFTWFGFTFLSDMGIMGTAMALKLSPRALFWLVVMNPAQSFKIAIVGELQKSFETFGAAGMQASELFGEWLFALLAGVMLAWVVIPLAAAFTFFRSRCVD